MAAARVPIGVALVASGQNKIIDICMFCMAFTERRSSEEGDESNARSSSGSSRILKLNGRMCMHERKKVTAKSKTMQRQGLSTRAQIGPGLDKLLCLTVESLIATQ